MITTLRALDIRANIMPSNGKLFCLVIKIHQQFVDRKSHISTTLHKQRQLAIMGHYVQSPLRIYKDVTHRPHLALYYLHFKIINHVKLLIKLG